MPASRRLVLEMLLAAVVGVACWRVAPTLPEPPAATGVPQRVVALSPALAELCFAIGAGDKLVAVSAFTNYPPAAVELPKVGGFINPNVELLVELKPDLLVSQGVSEITRDRCRGLGLRYVGYALDSAADVLQVVRRLADLLDCPAGGAAAATKLQRELHEVSDAVAGRPKVPVFVCVGRQQDRINGLMTCADGTFLGDLVKLAGGRNVFADAAVLYPQPSLEEVTARAPQVILDLQPENRDPAGCRAAWQDLSALPAVQHNRIEVLSEDYVMIPGSRLGQTAKRLAEALHPDLSFAQ